MTAYVTTTRGTKLKIQLAAHSILESSGYASLTTSRVAQEAGISVGAIYRYFRTKEDIFWYVSRQRLESLLIEVRRARSALRQELEIRSPLVRILDAYVNHYQLAPRLSARVIRIEQELGQPVDIQELQQQFLHHIEVAAMASDVPSYRGLASDILAVTNGLLATHRSDRLALPIAERIERIASGFRSTYKEALAQQNTSA